MARHPTVKNTYEIVGDVVIMTITSARGIATTVLIDAADLDAVRPYHWFVWYDSKYHAPYVVFENASATQRITLCQHIMQPPEGRNVMHNSDNSLDNRRSNMRVEQPPATLSLTEMTVMLMRRLGKKPRHIAAELGLTAKQIDNAILRRKRKAKLAASINIECN